MALEKQLLNEVDVDSEVGQSMLQLLQVTIAQGYSGKLSLNPKLSTLIQAQLETDVFLSVLSEHC